MTAYRESIGSITDVAVRRFCEVMGDTNPIHRDPDVARQAGFPGVVVPGALSGCVLLVASREALHEGHTGSVNIRFKRWLQAGADVVLERVDDRLLLRDSDDVVHAILRAKH